ncbi:hypothetical protein P389DRAFT_168999 [Cystobasidium minutum MCA 4210]|uniref:uncharacterized protein n=1 Tax=Cystobasidium minutum MCA 4210 TaxID=1397322 RepID=UPI0034CD0A86|eukprot:jgi/Rhomi1/168999/fgenesh1_kg.3_\
MCRRYSVSVYCTHDTCPDKDKRRKITDAAQATHPILQERDWFKKAQLIWLPCEDYQIEFDKTTLDIACKPKLTSIHPVEIETHQMWLETQSFIELPYVCVRHRKQASTIASSPVVMPKPVWLPKPCQVEEAVKGCPMGGYIPTRETVKKPKVSYERKRPPTPDAFVAENWLSIMSWRLNILSLTQPGPFTITFSPSPTLRFSFQFCATPRGPRGASSIKR